MIKTIYEKAEDVPELYKDLYEEKDGKFVLTGVEGLRTQTDVDKLSKALNMERAEHKRTKEKWLPVANHEPDDILKAFTEIEELKILAKDKPNVDELVETRIKGRLTPLERQINESTTKIKEYEATIDKYKASEIRRKISDNVRSALDKHEGFVPSASEDALMYAERIFEITDEGKVLTKDNVGVTPALTPEAWLVEIKDKKPHWFGATSGGGGKPGGVKLTSVTNPWKKETFNFSKQNEIAKQNPELAKQMMKLAGVS